MTLKEGAEMRPGSPSIMMLALKIPECSLTTGLIGGKAPIIKAPLIQVLSSVTPRSRGYGDVAATYIWRSEIPLRIYAKH